MLHLKPSIFMFKKGLKDKDLQALHLKPSILMSKKGLKYKDLQAISGETCENFCTVTGDPEAFTV